MVRPPAPVVVSNRAMPARPAPDTAATNADDQAATAWPDATAARAAAPIRSRRSGSPASVRTASTQASSVPARNPETPGAIIAAWTPTGLAITGRPAAWYWRTFSPHLPRLQRSSGTQLIPTSPAASASASVASIQGTATTGNGSNLGKRSQTTRSRTPGTSRPSRSQSARRSSSPCNVLDEPIQTRSIPAPGASDPARGR